MDSAYHLSVQLLWFQAKKNVKSAETWISERVPNKYCHIFRDERRQKFASYYNMQAVISIVTCCLHMK